MEPVDMNNCLWCGVPVGSFADRFCCEQCADAYYGEDEADEQEGLECQSLSGC